MEVSIHHHAQAVLCLGKEPPVPIEQEGRCIAYVPYLFQNTLLICLLYCKIA